MITAIIITVLAAIALAGIAWLAHLLRRDRNLIWRPGVPLPDVPADSALLTWRSRRPGPPPAAEFADPEGRVLAMRPAGSTPHVGRSEVLP